MVSVLEAPADKLILKISEKLKTDENIKPPAWAVHVKTGPHAERKPQEKDWWYTRCASLLRKLYIQGNSGVGRLRTWYGGRKCYGTTPEHHIDAGGSAIRKALQQLEKAGYVKKEKIGRTLTQKGRSLLDKTSLELGVKHGRRVEKEAAGAKPVLKRRARKARVSKTVAVKPPRSRGKRKAGEGETSKPQTSGKS